MKSEYTPAPTGEEIEANGLELPDAKIGQEQSRIVIRTQENQRQLLRQPLWKRTFPSTANRNIWIAVLLIFLASASIIGYIYYQTPRTGGKITSAMNIENEEEVPEEFTSVQSDDQNDENEKRLPQLRSVSYNEKSNAPEVVGQMYVYVRKPTDDDNRRAFDRLRFPVARYSRRNFPLTGPFISLMPSTPIFADGQSKQTIIYSKGGVYILPSLINRFEKRYSVAELIASDHASLFSSGVRPRGTINMAALFRSSSLMGSGVPEIDPVEGGFTGGIRTSYGSFSILRQQKILFDIDRMAESDEEEDDDQYTDGYRPRRRNSGYRKKYPTRTNTVPANGEILTVDASGKPSKTIDNVAYFQGSSLKNQLGGLTPKAVTYTGVDSANRYTVYRNGTLVHKTAGIYFGIYAIQIGSPRGNGGGNIHLWARQDGQDEPNSNSIQTIERGSTSVLVFSTVFQTPVGPGAVITFSAIVSGECTSLGLIATAFENEPVVPSIISSEIQLSDLKNPVHYASLTSSQTQLGSQTPNPVTMNDPGDISGVGTSTAATDGFIEFSESKLYFVIACGQVGSAPGTRAVGEVHLWSRLNGVDIPNSNTIQHIRNGNTAVLVTQGIVSVNANDKLQIVFSSTDSNLGLIASTPTNEPVVPSMIFATFELGTQQTSLPYAQFSSSISQWGCLTPKVVQMGNNDGSQRVTNNNGVIEFHEAGVYFLMAAGQVASFNGQGIGDLHLWMRLNGEDVANSNTIQTITNTDTTVLVSQGVAVLQAGDKLEVTFSTDVTIGKLGLVVTKPAGESVVPSIIFSAFKSNVQKDTFPKQKGQSASNYK